MVKLNKNHFVAIFWTAVCFSAGSYLFLKGVEAGKAHKARLKAVR